MKIKDKYVTSLVGLRMLAARHPESVIPTIFNNKREQFLRDLSPEEISFTLPPDDCPDAPQSVASPQAWFDVLRRPQAYQLTADACLKDDRTALPWRHNRQAAAKADNGKATETVLFLLALGELLGLSTADYLKMGTDSRIDWNKPVIALSYGQYLELTSPIPQLPQNCYLSHKPVCVPADVYTESQLGPVVLAPGQFTYAVFAGEHLVKVCPRQASNDAYSLEFVTDVRGKRLLRVTDKNGGTEYTYPMATFFCLIGNDSYARLEMEHIRCSDAELEKEIRHELSMKLPVAMAYADGKLTVTCYDGHEINILI